MNSPIDFSGRVKALVRSGVPAAKAIAMVLGGRVQRFADGGVVDPNSDDFIGPPEPDTLPPPAATVPPLSPIAQQVAQSRQDMAAAQDTANQNRLIAGMAGAAGRLAASTYGATRPMDETGFKALEDNANAPVTAILQRQQAARQAVQDQTATQQATQSAAMMDPTSAQSQAFRKAVEKISPGIANAYGDSWNDVTASDKDLILKPIELREQMDARKQQAALQAGIRVDSQVDKAAAALKDDLDPNKARGGNLAKNQARVDNATRIQALLDQVHSNPDPRQMEELAISTQALLSQNGTPGAEQVKALIPSTAWGNIQKFKEWLTNDPTGTEQQAFVQRMADTVRREKDVASQQVQTAQSQRLPAHQWLKKRAPDQYNAIVNGYGLGDGPTTAGGTTSQAPAAGTHGYKAGDIVTVKGKQYTVGPDGDSLSPVGG